MLEKALNTRSLSSLEAEMAKMYRATLARIGYCCLFARQHKADAYLAQNVFTKQKLGADFVISIISIENHKTKHAARL